MKYDLSNLTINEINKIINESDSNIIGIEFNNNKSTTFSIN